MNAYTFLDISLILGSTVVAVISTVVAVTLLLRRRRTKAENPGVAVMLATMARSEMHRGKLNPDRLGLVRL